MAKIKKISARQIFDSRGVPTVEADVYLDDGAIGRFATPAGASCGSKEALELRDNNMDKYQGKGVSQAVNNISKEISQALIGHNFNQAQLDDCLIKLDGTANKSRLGANAILAVSGAFFHAQAHAQKLPLYQCYGEACLLPMPLVNVINGGAHANNGLDIQEFMLVPTGAACLSEALRCVAEIFYSLKSLLKTRGFSTAVGDEGGFAPALNNNEAALELLMIASKQAGYEPGQSVFFAMDVAANEMFDQAKQAYRVNNLYLDHLELLNWYKKLADNFPICSIEDPFHETDYHAFMLISKEMESRMQIVGDDLFVTNIKYIQQGIEYKYANSVLIKMNQIGTISETLAAIGLAKKAGLNTIISHRSGETEDTTIADLAVLSAAGQIKTGSMSRSERLAKYNRLLRIEEELGNRALFNNPFHLRTST